MTEHSENEPSRDREGAVKEPDTTQPPDKSIPLAYLITFTCYGTRLHGDEAGSVDRRHNLPGSDFLLPNPPWFSAVRGQMKQRPYEMGGRQRYLVLQTLRDVCVHRGWTVLAAHVRTNHVHAVIVACDAPEKTMSDIKTYASRALNRTGWEPDGCLRWTRHGSTRYLWKPEDVTAAIDYVVRRQGEPLAVWENPEQFN